MIQVPSGCRIRTKIELVKARGCPNLYFKKIGALTPDDRPKAMQELEKLHKELQQVLVLIAEAIQVDYPVDIGYAYLKAGSLRRHSRKNAQVAQQVTIDSFLVEEDLESSETHDEVSKIKITEGAIALNPNDWIKLPNHQTPLIINRAMGGGWYEILPVSYQVEPGTVGDRLDLKIGQYATDEEIKRIDELNNKSPDVAIQAVTLFMQYRVLHPVEDVEAVKADAEFIRLPVLNFDLQAGDRLKFMGEGRPVTLEVSQGISASDYDEEYVDIRIKPARGAIAAGTVGFLMDGRELMAGQQEWTEKDTRRKLPEPLIAEIFKFHQAESSPKKEESDDEESRGKGFAKKDEKSSSKSGRKRRSTGTNTTGESKAIESATPDSTTKTLEAAHAA